MNLLNEEFWVSRFLEGKYLPEEQTKLLQRIKTIYYTAPKFDYAGFQVSEEFIEMQTLSAALKIFNLTELDNEDKKTAFWVNTFNMLVLNAVTLDYPIKKINTKMFAESCYQVGHEVYSLDDIEHGLLRANSAKSNGSGPYFTQATPKEIHQLQSKNAGLHFFYYSACKSSPSFTVMHETNTSKQIEDVVQTELHRTVKIENNKVFIPKIFKWYSNDFGGKHNTLSFIQTHADTDLKKALASLDNNPSIKFQDFDWSIND